MGEIEKIKDKIQYQEAWYILREIWYEISEGYIQISPILLESGYVQQNVAKRIPKGWKISIMLHGDVQMHYQLSEQNMFILIYKNRNGKKMEQIW